jgi:hypothetical protein
MDARRNASATTKDREYLMAHILNDTVGDQLLIPTFPCPAEAFQGFVSIFKGKYPDAGETSRTGGMGKHYDLNTTSSSRRLHLELKVTCDKPSHLAELSWRPWLDTVQFLQGQTKSKMAKRFLGECGDDMLRAWYEQYVKPLSVSVPASSGMSYAGYAKAMYTIKMKGKQEAAAVAFINALRTEDDLKDSLHKKWLAFEADWFSSHTLNHEKLKEVVKDIIEAKDAWICVSNIGPQLIGGLNVVDLQFNAARPKPKGGMSFHYILTLTRDGIIKEVPMECKFHWKNGGQAVQNLNFMLL